MSGNADFLVEIGTEELPPKALHKLERAFADGIQHGVLAAGLERGEIRSFSTPRRLAVLVRDLDLEQPPQRIEKRGPPTKVAFDRDGNPTRAAEAFAQGCNVPLEALEKLETDKGDWLMYRAEEPGRAAAEILPEIVISALASLPIPKRMRWGENDEEFVRPVHWILMLLGDQVLDAEVLGHPAGGNTRGHRFHAPGHLKISAPDDYHSILMNEGKVIAEFEQRRERIHKLADETAKKLGGQAILDADVLDEVTALVEWPVPVSGKFNAEFLRLPEEVLIATLQDHQRYFPVRSKDGNLMPNFIAMSNIESSDPEQVQSGNERVIAPRLADADFFWTRDCRSSLDSRRDALKQVVFQRELGSLYDKSDREGALAGALAADLGVESESTKRAVALSKTDLLTDMVGEFPELQGRMGYYYALHDGESEAVAKAIEEAYLPRQAGDRLPSTPEGRILALADRLDTLAGIFAVGKRPSGNKDPFGLRRAALGLLRILIEEELDLDLNAYLRRAIAAQPVDVADDDVLLLELYEFIIDRLKTYYLEGQAPGLEAGAVTPEMFESVRVRKPVSPLDFHQRLNAVCHFMKLDAAESLAMSNKRIANILRSAPEETKTTSNPELFETSEERSLHDAVNKLSTSLESAIKERDYVAALESLSMLKNPIDEFFDSVLVMTDDSAQRQNRIALLHQLRELFLEVADLSCIPNA